MTLEPLLARGPERVEPWPETHSKLSRASSLLCSSPTWDLELPHYSPFSIQSCPSAKP